MSGYGEVVRETAGQAEERKVEALMSVLIRCDVPPCHLSPWLLRKLAEACLAAVEAGF